MLRIITLGGWHVSRDDAGPQAIPTQRVSLLALLVVAGDRGIARDKAAALLWPDSTDENARHSLGQSVYALRRDAASPEVVLGTTVLRLNREVVTCDAWELDLAARADDGVRVAELYHGPFLDGVHLRGSAQLEHTIDAERSRLAALHGEALESLARADAERGRLQSAAAWWKRLAGTQPLSSRIAAELVRALVAAGDRTAALQAVRVHETLVREELDAMPDPAFAELAESLRAEPAVRPTVRAQLARDDSSVPDESEAARVTHTIEPPLPSNATSQREPALPNVTGRRPTVTRRVMFGALAAATVLTVPLGWKRFVRVPEPLETTRVYVAPFENRTGDPKLDQIGALASDWVSQGLEQTGVVAVASTSRAEDGRPVATASSHDGSRAEHRAAELGAGTVVSGAYYKVGDRLRFQVQIGDVDRGEVLDVFDATGVAMPDPSGALEAVRQRTVGSLASFVDPRLRSWVRVASKPPTYDAYREFVTGQSIWGSDHRQALVHFQRAAELDSTFYAARVETAILHRLLGECDRTESIARELGEVRGKLAPYEYHVLDEQVAQCEGDWERAYRQARAVVDLRPSSAFLEYSLALQAMQLGRFSEAKELLSHHALEQGVAEVGPNYAIVLAQLLAVSGDRTRSADAARWLRTHYPRYARGWSIALTLQARTGRVDAAERLIDTIVTLRLEPRAAVVMGLRRAAASFAYCGDTAAARRTLSRALDVLEAPIAGRLVREESDRAQMLYELGRLTEAQALLTQLVTKDSSDVDARGYLGLIAAQRHDTAVAAAADAWLDAARTPYVFTRTMYRARIAAVLGDRDRALALLPAALDEMGRFLVPAVREYRELRSLRSDERFSRMLALR